MRVLQITIVKILSLLTMLAGAILVAVTSSATVRGWLEPYVIPEGSIWLGSWLGTLLGGLVFLVGLLGLLPVVKPKRLKKTISFAGSHGEVTIQLDSVEATLARMVSRMPVVKKIWVRIIPSEDNHRARVAADVWVYKNADRTSAREITNSIMEHLMDTAVNILGVEEITAVDVNVRGIIPGKVSSSKSTNEETPKKSEIAHAPAASPPDEAVPTPADAEDPDRETPADVTEEHGAEAEGGPGRTESTESNEG